MRELALSAGVAELADAQDLGSCGLKTVEVRVLSPAPSKFATILVIPFRFQILAFHDLMAAEPLLPARGNLNGV
jgi:hypothetical protein